MINDYLFSFRKSVLGWGTSQQLFVHFEGFLPSSAKDFARARLTPYPFPARTAITFKIMSLVECHRKLGEGYPLFFC
jgi:hypothetical protein